MSNQDNNTLRTEASRRFFVIITTNDQGITKYLSKKYPYIFRHTVKLDKARQFDRRLSAERFLDDYNSRLGLVGTIHEVELVMRLLKGGII